MDDKQKELFRMILEEVLNGISEKEFADMIDTFVEIYEQKFGVIATEDDVIEPELLHTKEASEYLKRFKL